MKKINHVFFRWLPLGASIVLIFGFVYGSIQQYYRQSLNDPQIQIVTDAVLALKSGVQPADVVGKAGLFDVQSNLYPFIAVYDSKGNLLESSATIGNKTPKPPVGVFEYTKSHGENRVTWQPNASTRIALVVKPVNNASGWYVASGRNMSEVESRIANFTKITFLALGATLVISFFITLVVLP